MARAPFAPRVLGDAPASAIRPLAFVPPSGQTWRSYYYAGTQRIAVRVEGDPTPANNGPFYLLNDHLGSTSVTTDASGNKVAELRYYPYGQRRYSWNTTPTSHRFTGQISDEDSTGLYFFNARYYSGVLGRFISADTVVPEPGNPQSLNRFSYSANNPLRYIDPSGHDWLDSLGQFFAGVAFQWSVTNREAVVPSSPEQRQAVEALAVDTDAFVAGRAVGALVAAVQGVVEFDAGIGSIGGGVTACGTGVLCVAGAPAIAAGAVVMAHGASVAIHGALDAGEQLNILFAKKGKPAEEFFTPDELKQYNQLKQQHPDWMPDDDAALSVRSKDETAAARAQVKSPGHHPHPLKFGGEPNPPGGLVQTGDTRTEKNPIHVLMTNFWNAVMRRR
jgi:RHS repeat-associated protein